MLEKPLTVPAGDFSELAHPQVFVASIGPKYPRLDWPYAAGAQKLLEVFGGNPCLRSVRAAMGVDGSWNYGPEVHSTDYG